MVYGERYGMTNKMRGMKSKMNLIFLLRTIHRISLFNVYYILNQCAFQSNSINYTVIIVIIRNHKENQFKSDFKERKKYIE